MNSRTLVALLLAVGGSLALFAGLDTKSKEDLPPVKKEGSSTPAVARVLPGLMADGTVQLPNQWKLRPAGKQIEVGNFPVNQALHPSGQYLAVLHSGMQEHEVVILDLNKTKQRIVSRATVDQTFYGLCFSPDGRKSEIVVAGANLVGLAFAGNGDMIVVSTQRVYRVPVGIRGYSVF